MSDPRKAHQGAMIGGVAMMVGAVVWFVVGWFAGYIFFYPPILFVLGIGGILKGLKMKREIAAVYAQPGVEPCISCGRPLRPELGAGSCPGCGYQPEGSWG